jgi:DNA polymerase-3 subunit alpha
MDPVAQLGLLKMDFLGLTNLTILDRAVKLLKESRDVDIDLNTLPLDDRPTFELLSSGNTNDLFQLESAGMQRYIKELKPSNLGDIAAMIALYRPGPMENIDNFINSKHGRAPITYPHPSLKELLDETYGVIVYQDQVLLVLQQFAGYSLGSADIVRKAMGKKIASLMAQERDRFVSGAQEKGFDEGLAVDIFNLIEPFAGYAFNKAHSVSYALISYWTAYFKAHYPVEYMTSVLNSRMDHPDKIVSSINECFRLGIPVLLPDLNRSEEFFTIDAEDAAKPVIRIGLAAVKTVGAAAVRPLVAERIKNGAYASIEDFCGRADARGLNRRTLESLVRAGAFDHFGPRGPILGILDQIIATAQLRARSRDSGQTTMFEVTHSGDNSGLEPGFVLSGPDVSKEQKAAWEQELLGLPLSYNPLFALATVNSDGAISSLDQLDDEMQGQTLSLLGHVSTVSQRYTRDQKQFLIVSLDLLGGPIEVVVWPDVLERIGTPIWQAGKVLRLTGKLRHRGDQFSLVCEQVAEYDPVTTNGDSQSDEVPENRATPNVQGAGGKPNAVSSNGKHQRTITLCVTESEDPAGDALVLREVIGVLLEYPGKDRVNLKISTGGRNVKMELPVVTTQCCESLTERLETLLGSQSVAVDTEARAKWNGSPP